MQPAGEVTILITLLSLKLPIHTSNTSTFATLAWEVRDRPLSREPP